MDDHSYSFYLVSLIVYKATLASAGFFFLSRIRYIFPVNTLMNKILLPHRKLSICKSESKSAGAAQWFCYVCGQVIHLKYNELTVQDSASPTMHCMFNNTVSFSYR